jgi:uncharacterized damage-inducible protein DinB
MKTARLLRSPHLIGAAILLHAVPAQAQSTPADFRDEFLRQFDASTRKLTALAAAMPESLYTWSPGEGVMPVGQVYMHIARYNFLYPATSLGIAAPPGIDLESLEQIRNKAEVARLLGVSAEHVRVAARQMTPEQLAESTVLYGRNVAKWAVLLQLVAHMNEHVGQSVSYARMNGIVPPWSR